MENSVHNVDKQNSTREARLNFASVVKKKKKKKKKNFKIVSKDVNREEIKRILKICIYILFIFKM